MTAELRNILGLPVDSIHDILSRLPLKSLLQYKSVSKQFYALISSSSFRKLFKKKQKKNNPFLLLWDSTYETEPETQTSIRFLKFQVIDLTPGKQIRSETKKVKKFHSEFNFPTIPHEPPAPGPLFTVEALDLDQYYATSCNGLVCIANQSSGEGVYVINPMTTDFVKLPAPYRHDHSDMMVGTRICIGYLPSVNQFKIVSWHHQIHSDLLAADTWKMGCEILTLTDQDQDQDQPHSSHSWRMVERTYPGIRLRMETISKCINGVIYWLASTWQDEIRVMGLLAFDLKTEEVSIIPVPQDVSAKKRLVTLTELKESLCLMKPNGIWMLIKEDKPGSGPSYLWMKKFSFDHWCARIFPLLYKDSKEVAQIWNAESGNIQYLCVRKDKNTIEIYDGETDDYPWEGIGLAIPPGSGHVIPPKGILPNKKGTPSQQKQILFYGNLFSLDDFIIR